MARVVPLGDTKVEKWCRYERRGFYRRGWALSKWGTAYVMSINVYRHFVPKVVVVKKIQHGRKIIHSPLFIHNHKLVENFFLSTTFSTFPQLYPQLFHNHFARFLHLARSSVRVRGRVRACARPLWKTCGLARLARGLQDVWQRLAAWPAEQHSATWHTGVYHDIRAGYQQAY